MMRKAYFERFNETVYTIKLKSGMQVHLLPKKDPYYTTYVELTVNYGAIDLKVKSNGEIKTHPAGTAHFLEHKMFAMPDGDAFAKFSKLGVDANAMTSNNQTSYLFSATQNVIPALSHLLEMIDLPYFTTENVESEKSIIAEELKMYLDQMDTVLMNTLLENMYHVHPVRNDIGGTLDSIMEITPETLSEAYQHFYQPRNRILVIAGKINLKEMQDFFKSYEHRQEPQRRSKKVYPKEPLRLVKKHVEQEMPVQMEKLMLGVKLPYRKRTDINQRKREIAFNLLLNILFGSSSKNYEDLLEKRWINQNFYVSSSFEKGAEYLTIYAESKYVKRLKTILTDILVHAHDYIDEIVFNRFKKVYLGQLIYSLNHLETKAYLYAKFLNQGLQLYEMLDLLDHITIEDVYQVSQEIQKSRISSVIFKKPK